jgi:hypothetical protein
MKVQCKVGIIGQYVIEKVSITFSMIVKFTKQQNISIKTRIYCSTKKCDKDENNFFTNQ